MHKILVQFRPKGGADCQSIDHYLDFSETDTYSDIYNKAVDYIHGQIVSGRRYSQGRDFCASAAEYDIEIGPFLGIPA